MNILEKYKESSLNLFSDSTYPVAIIVYGSSIYNYNQKISDLDVCFILDDDQYSEQIIAQLINMTVYFHMCNSLPIDEEIPFENKLVFSVDEVKETLSGNLFCSANGVWEIPPIIKTHDFLSSKLMKKRLLLNILTSDHILLSGDENTVKKFEERAWEIIIEAVVKCFNPPRIDVETVLSLLLRNPITLEEGEMYLGYKSDLSQKEKYLRMVLNQRIDYKR